MMAWERKIGKRFLVVGIHTKGIAIGIGISRYSIDIDFICIYIGLEL